MFLLCLVRVVVICLLLYILDTLFININSMESTSTGWGYVIIHLPPITQMPLNQTDVAVDEELEKVIIAIDNSTQTGLADYESGYEYFSGETTEHPVK